MSSGARQPYVGGAGVGVVAWLLGYVCTYLVAGTRVRESALNQVLELAGGASTYKLVGWTFYNSHFVETAVEGLPARVTSTVGGEGGFTVLLFFVPPVLLVAAGLAVARYQGSDTPEAGGLAGLTVVPGYLVVVFLGAVAFVVSVGPVSGRPPIVLAVVLAGLVYPGIFGALGGVLAGATADE
jgi:hypothetical protein